MDRSQETTPLELCPQIAFLGNLLIPHKFFVVSASKTKLVTWDRSHDPAFGLKRSSEGLSCFLCNIPFLLALEFSMKCFF